MQKVHDLAEKQGCCKKCLKFIAVSHKRTKFQFTVVCQPNISRDDLDAQDYIDEKGLCLKCCIKYYFYRLQSFIYSKLLTN